jgi:thioredoxin 1
MIEVKRFHAEWCSPCKALAPVFETIKSNHTDVKFEDIDVDAQFEIASKYSIRSVPTVIVEKDGVEVHRFAGLQAEMTYNNALNELKSA